MNGIPPGKNRKRKGAHRGEGEALFVGKLKRRKRSQGKRHTRDLKTVASRRKQRKERDGRQSEAVGFEGRNETCERETQGGSPRQDTGVESSNGSPSVKGKKKVNQEFTTKGRKRWSTAKKGSKPEETGGRSGDSSGRPSSERRGGRSESSYVRGKK